MGLCVLPSDPLESIWPQTGKFLSHSLPLPSNSPHPTLEGSPDVVVTPWGKLARGWGQNKPMSVCNKHSLHFNISFKSRLVEEGLWWPSNLMRSKGALTTPNATQLETVLVVKAC